MKHILITGGLGNLGSWLSRFFAHSPEWKVYILSARKRSLVVEFPYTFIEADICNPKLKEIVTPYTFDVVVHTASINEGNAPGYAKNALEINSYGTRNLIEALAVKESALPHFIYFSTFHAYGKDSGQITEDTQPTPLNDYGLTHYFAEQYVEMAHRTKGLPFTIIRLSNSYGAPLDLDSSKWYLILNDLSKMAFKQQQIILKSNGKAPRDFIWMGDVCKVVAEFAAKEPTNEVYNVCSSKSYTMLYIAEQVQEAYGKSFGKKIPISVNENDTKEYPQVLQLSNERLLNFYPFQFEEKFIAEAQSVFELLESREK